MRNGLVPSMGANGGTFHFVDDLNHPESGLAWSSKRNKLRGIAGGRMSKDSKGFSWIELIVGIVVIILVAKILVPSIISKQSDIDETSAVLSIRAIMQAEDNYAQAYDHGYSESLATLGPPPQAMPNSTLAGYLDNELAAGKKQGYVFAYRPSPADENGRIQSYTLSVSPAKPGQSGTKYYFVGPTLGDEKTEIIRVNSSQTATAADKPLGT